MKGTTEKAIGLSIKKTSPHLLVKGIRPKQHLPNLKPMKEITRKRNENYHRKEDTDNSMIKEVQREITVKETKACSGRPQRTTVGHRTHQSQGSTETGDEQKNFIWNVHFFFLRERNLFILMYFDCPLYLNVSQN